jgi:RHS repeat-associated protein
VESNVYRGTSNLVSGFSDEDHLLTAGSDVYQWDVDGFLDWKQTAQGTTDYTWSSRGELLAAGLPDGRIITWEHDPLGRRIAKLVNGAVTEKYLWADMTTLLAVYDGAGSLKQRFVYADARMPVGMTQGGQTYYFLWDQVGTLRGVVDSSGTLVKRLDYDSFGYVVSDSNPGFTVPFGFAGGLYDPDTKLVRFGYRDYDPVIGRWSAKDPIDFAGGDPNLYGYVMNNPVNLADPLGRSAADVAKITQRFYELLVDMNQRGLRDPNAFINNANAMFHTFSGGVVGKDYLVCTGQSTYVKYFLEQEDYEDEWKFVLDHSYLPAHTWGLAISSNPNDPIIIFDPLYGQIGR